MSAPGLSRWTIAVAAFFLGSLVTLVLAGGASYMVYRSLRPAPSRAAGTRPVFARQDFSRRVLGKTESEVIAAVGRPDETSEDNDARYWHFKKRTRDPLTQEEDTDVQVVIKQGKVTDINY